MGERLTIHPNGAPALIGSRSTVSYERLCSLASGTATRLKAQGIVATDRVGLRCEDHIAAIVAMLALWQLGAVAVPISSRFTPSQVDRVRTLTGARAWLDDDALCNGLLAEGNPSPIDISLDRSGTILFTSGTTGEPRPVVHPLSAHYFSARGANKNMPLHADSRWLLSLPLYHVGGLGILWRCLVSGAGVAVPDPACSLGDALAIVRPTHLSLVYTQLVTLLSGKESRLDGLTLLLGGGPIPAHVAAQAVSRGATVSTSYGLTEAASQVTATSPTDPIERLHSSGCTLPYRELCLDSAGQIHVRGKTMFASRLDSSGKASPVSSDQWHATGDLGSIDADGYLSVHGRQDRMFVSGGENIFPEEIERLLEEHPAVSRAVVVDIPDRTWGARPAAFVQFAVGSHASWRELAEFATERVEKFKTPRLFLDLDPSWLGPLGKPDLAVLKSVAEKAAAD